MTDAQLRALVREALTRHIGAGPGEPRSVRGRDECRSHPSHGTFRLATGTDGDGPCLIEPAVACNHCGYCTSYGH